MSHQLKPLTKAGIDNAMAKAERYRLLNEPKLAESICLDVLQTDPGHRQAVIVLLLARTDQFHGADGRAEAGAWECVEKLGTEYEREYYSGVILERKAHAKLESRTPQAGSMAYDLFRKAMAKYEEAERIRPAGNDDALLRWNTCVRVLEENRLEPYPHDHLDDEHLEPGLE